MKAHRAPRRRREDRTTPALVEESPLRGVDPRVKLALSLGLSLAVMLPLAQVAAVLALYTLLLFWARLLPLAARQAWRLRGVLLVLFVVDWLVVSLELAAIVSLRILLLTGTFTLLVATTTSDELQLALVWLRLPYRYAFSVSLAFQSLHLLEEEWRTILEAQRARGAWNPPRNLRGLWQQTRELTALTVPAIVLATRRAWALTEAAYARGFDSPRRRPYRQLRLARLDWALLVGAVVVAAGLLAWRLGR
ncbi:MAG TPA: energy-coupling factor transporter transmembrane component T [Anaerolineae bacterium]|nr:energy-coupling factor transporter transmembrane component T [Anaerolineae bacterium]